MKMNTIGQLLANWRKSVNAGKVRLFTTTIGAVAVLSICSMSIAFDPDNENYGHSFITRKVAEDGATILGMEVKGFTAKVKSGEIAFSEDAVEHLVLGARSIDFLALGAGGEDAGNSGFYLNEEFGPGGLFLYGLPFDPVAHCDDDQIVLCSTQVADWTIGSADAPEGVNMYNESSAVSILKKAADLWIAAENPNASDAEEKQAKALRFAAGARVRVGRALHTLQDFYAHSNWSDSRQVQGENFLREFGQLDKKEFVGGLLAPANSSTCVSILPNPATIEEIRNFYSPLNPLSHDANLYANYVANADLKPLLADAIALSLYSGLKSKLTYDNSGGNWQILPGAKLTSGFFDSGQHTFLGVGSATDTPDRVRCDHGFNKNHSHLSGINKDTPKGPFAPEPSSDGSSVPHSYASYHALLGTKQVFQNVIDQIEVRSGYKENPSEENTKMRDTMVELFLGIKPTVVFVVDTTGSMQDIMDGVATQVEAIGRKEVEDDAAGNSNKPAILKKKFMLVTYSENLEGKPDIITHQIASGENSIKATYGSAAQVVAKLRTLKATGGGDCKEPTMAAILKTIKKLAPRSKVYVFTDASSHDNVVNTALGPQKESVDILRLSRLRQIEVNFSVSGSCSPVDNNFKSISAKSSGQMMLVDHTAIDTNVALAAHEVSSTPLAAVHLERGSLAVGATKEIVLPIESAVSQLLLTVTIDASDGLVLKDPQGKVQSKSPFLGGALWKVSKPMSGNWRLSMSLPSQPTGVAFDYNVKAQVAGNFDLKSVEYSEVGGTQLSAHDTHLQYGSAPPPERVRIGAKLSTNAANNPSLYLWQAIAEDGKVLGNLEMSRSTIDRYEGFAALDTISANASRSWRVRVTGTDANGAAFARMLPVLQNALPRQIGVSDLPRYWLVGASHELKFHVKNYLAGDTMNLVASSTLGQVQIINPTQDIATGASTSFAIKLNLPANLAPNSVGVLSLSLYSRAAGGALIEKREVPVYVLLDTDGDGVPDKFEKGALGTDQNYDGNGDGVVDWKQANVVSLHSHLARAYITASLSAGKFGLMRTALANEESKLSYNLDLFDFKILGLAAGSTTQMSMQLPNYMSAQSFAMFGPEASNKLAHWYDFLYDGNSKIGTKTDKNIINLFFVDGARGDADLQANGEVLVFGGPSGVRSGVNFAASASNPSTPATPGTATIPPTGGSSGGGGCTVGQPGQNDMSLPLLSVLALAGIAYRRRRARVKR